MIEFEADRYGLPLFVSGNRADDYWSIMNIAQHSAYFS